TRFSRDWSSDVCSSDLTFKDVERFQSVLIAIETGRRVDADARLPVLLDDQRLGFGCGRGQRAGSRQELVWRKRVRGLRVLRAGRSEERRVGKECRSRWW